LSVCEASEVGVVDADALCEPAGCEEQCRRLADVSAVESVRADSDALGVTAGECRDGCRPAVRCRQIATVRAVVGVENEGDARAGGGARGCVEVGVTAGCALDGRDTATVAGRWPGCVGWSPVERELSVEAVAEWHAVGGRAPVFESPGVGVAVGV
jgi:hypothetical protein